MKESSIEKRLREFVEDTLDGMCIKLPAAVLIGIPDRLILLPGARVEFVELKRNKKKPTLRQDRIHGRLRKMGFRVTTIAGLEQLEKWRLNYAER